MFLHITLADIMVTLFPIAGQPPASTPWPWLSNTTDSFHNGASNEPSRIYCTYNHKEDQTYRKIRNYLDNLWWLLGAFASLANDKTTFGLDNQWESMGLALVLTRRRPQFGPSPWSCNFEFVKIRLRLYLTSSQTLTSDQHLPLLDPHCNLVSGQMVWEIMDRRWTAGWGFCKVSASILIIQNISNYLVCRMCSGPGYPLQTIYHKLTDWPFITI